MHRLFVILVIFSAVIFFSCEKKTDQTDMPDGVKSDEETSETTTEDEEVVEPVVIPDLKGTWTGTFDGRATTLNITEQTDSSFSGNLSIKYRETIYQEVKGSFGPSSKQLKMTDQIHSKFMGKYDGKISDDWKDISGTFTKNRDGQKTTFNLNHK